jgi:hypothetical protein
MRARKRQDAAAKKVGGEAAGTSLTRGWVIEKLMANANRAIEGAPILDKRGVATGEYRYEGSVANKALELLGTELGMFKDAKPLEPASMTPDLPKMSDNELARRMALILMGKANHVGYSAPSRAEVTSAAKIRELLGNDNTV